MSEASAGGPNPASDLPSLPSEDRSFWQLVRAGDLVLLSDRQLLQFGLLLALAIATAVTIALRLLEPPPPTRLSITAGAPSGAYHAWARRYAKAFAEHGITLEVRESRGSVENLQRLADPASGIAIGLVQSGIGDPETHPMLESLASVAYEPLWVFYRPQAGAARLESLSALAGQRIAIGAQGSGNRVLAAKLLQAHGLGPPSTTFTEDGGADAVQALLDGRVDAAFLIAAVDAPSVRLALTEGLQPMSFARADAFVRLMPWLSKLTLPQGVVDLARNLPATDITLVAASANLVVRQDLHPAIAYLMMDVATQLHRGQTLVNGPREFPAERNLDFAQSKESQRYFRNGRPFLQRYLPFWLANLIERFALTLLPAMAILLPLARLLPGLLGWRALSRILKLYHDVERLERLGELAPENRAAALAHLDRIERSLSESRLGARRLIEKYNLKSHLAMLRARLERG